MLRLKTWGAVTNYAIDPPSPVPITRVVIFPEIVSWLAVTAISPPGPEPNTPDLMYPSLIIFSVGALTVTSPAPLSTCGAATGGGGGGLGVAGVGRACGEHPGGLGGGVAGGED